MCLVGKGDEEINLRHTYTYTHTHRYKHVQEVPQSRTRWLVLTVSEFALVSAPVLYITVLSSFSRLYRTLIYVYIYTRTNVRLHRRQYRPITSDVLHSSNVSLSLSHALCVPLVLPESASEGCSDTRTPYQSGGLVYYHPYLRALPPPQ